MTRIVVTTEENESEGEIWKVYSPITDEEVKYVKPLGDMANVLSYGALTMRLYDGTLEDAQNVVREAVNPLDWHFESQSMRKFSDNLKAIYERMREVFLDYDEGAFVEWTTDLGLFDGPMDEV